MNSLSGKSATGQHVVAWRGFLTHCCPSAAVIYPNASCEALFVNWAISGRYLVVIGTVADTWACIKCEAVKWKWDLFSIPSFVPNKVLQRRLSRAEQN